MKNIHAEKILKEIKDFVMERKWGKYHTPKNLAISISIEANELLEHFQWSNPEFSEIRENEEKFKGISHEIADIFIYLIMFADLLGMDIEKVVMEKIKINRKKYPANQ